MRYDNSVKKLILKKFQSKTRICSIAKDFGIDRGTVRIWKNLYNQDLESNNLEFDNYFEVKKVDRTSTRLYDYQALKKFIDENPSSTQNEMIREFKCSKGTVWKVLNYLGHSRKRVRSGGLGLPEQSLATTNDSHIKNKIQ